MVQTADSTGEATQVRRAGNGATRSWPAVGSVDLILVLIVVLAAVLRFWHIGEQSLWYDEFITSEHLSKRFAQMLIEGIPQVEGTPPLSLLLGWFWIRILGDGDAILRSLSAVEGIATVPVVYALARELRLSRRIARVAALLIAVNPMLVWYSQEARVYSLFVLLGALSLFCCVRARNDDRTRNFVLWGLASAAALCTHYFAVLLVLPEAVWLALTYRTQLRKVARGCIPLAVVAIPLLVLALVQAGKNQAWISDFPIGQRLAEAGRSVLLGPAQPYDQWWPLGAALLIGAAVIALVFGDAHERSTAAIMVVLGSVGFVLALLASAVGSDYILGRNFIVVVVPLAIVVAIGFGSRRAGWIGIAAALVLSAGWIAVVVEVGINPDFQKPDWRAVCTRARDGNARPSRRRRQLPGCTDAALRRRCALAPSQEAREGPGP